MLRRRARLRSSPLPPTAENRLPVFVLSIYDWEFRRQRPQHLAAGLAARGHPVFVVSRTTISTGGATAHPLEPGVEEIRLPLPHPLAQAEAFPLDAQFVSAAVDAIDALCRSRGFERAIVLVQMPSWGPVALELRRRLGWPLVYDCLDDWSDFPGTPAPVVDAEALLVAGADHVVVSSDALHERWSARARELTIVRNGADVEHFTHHDDVDLLRGISPLIGYVGAIAEWFDAAAIAATAAACPRWTFALVGRVSVPLRFPPNVLTPGEKPYDLVPAWIARFDVCTIPFQTGALTRATNPVKLYEYFALGKPVVSSPIPEVLRHRDLVYVAEGTAGWIAAVDLALAETDPSLREARMRVAQENDWRHRVDQLAALLSAL